MKVEIPYELVKETIKELTDQINMEMEAEDPCPGIGVPADKQYPWYVELRNCLQEQVDKIEEDYDLGFEPDILWFEPDKRNEDYNLGFEFAKHLYQRAIDNEIDYEDIVCPANVSNAFEEGFSDCICSASEEESND